MKIPSHWTFDDTTVAEAFDHHVREQLPWYDLVTNAVAQVARHYIPTGGLVYDLGAATGNIGRALHPVLDERDAHLCAIERSRPMVERYEGPGDVLWGSLEQETPEPHDFAVSMLTLMFLAPRDVPTVLDRFLTHLRPGGALVVVERTIPPPGYLSVVTSRLTLAAKAGAGVTGQEIVAKELSLTGVQRPLHPHVLTSRGAVEWFRFGDFAGYIIEKEATS